MRIATRTLSLFHITNTVPTREYEMPNEVLDDTKYM